MIQEPCWPQRFHHQRLPLHYCADPTLAEQPLFDRHATGSGGQLWQGPAGFVMPGSAIAVCRAFRRSETVCQPGMASLAAPLRRRLSPTGPGITNLSLARLVYHSLGEAAEPIYLFLCGLLQRTLSTFGVASHFQAVSGSFCDGRYNLACGEGGQVRK